MSLAMAPPIGALVPEPPARRVPKCCRQGTLHRHVSFRSYAPPVARFSAFRKASTAFWSRSPNAALRPVPMAAVMATAPCDWPQPTDSIPATACTAGPAARGCNLLRRLHTGWQLVRAGTSAKQALAAATGLIAPIHQQDDVQATAGTGQNSAGDGAEPFGTYPLTLSGDGYELSGLKGVKQAFPTEVIAALGTGEPQKVTVRALGDSFSLQLSARRGGIGKPRKLLLASVKDLVLALGLKPGAKLRLTVYRDGRTPLVERAEGDAAAAGGDCSRPEWPVRLQLYGTGYRLRPSFKVMEQLLGPELAGRVGQTVPLMPHSQMLLEQEGSPKLQQHGAALRSYNPVAAGVNPVWLSVSLDPWVRQHGGSAGDFLMLSVAEGSSAPAEVAEEPPGPGDVSHGPPQRQPLAPWAVPVIHARLRRATRLPQGV